MRQEDGLVHLAGHIGWVDEPLGIALAEALGAARHRAVRTQRGRPGRAGRAHPRGGGRRGQRDLPARRRRRRRRHHRRRPGRSPATAATAARSATWSVNPQGRPCSCGSRGCWETEIGEYAADPRGRAGRRPAARRCRRWSTRPTAATRWRRPRCARSATGSASAWPTWSTSSTRRWSSSAARCATSTWPRRPRCAAGSTACACRPCREHVRLRTPALGDDALLLGAAELAFERLLADPIDVATGNAAGGARPSPDARGPGHAGPGRIASRSTSLPPSTRLPKPPPERCTPVSRSDSGRRQMRTWPKSVVAGEQVIAGRAGQDPLPDRAEHPGRALAVHEDEPGAAVDGLGEQDLRPRRRPGRRTTAPGISDDRGRRRR